MRDIDVNTNSTGSRAPRQRSLNIRLALTTLLASLIVATLITAGQMYVLYRSARVEAQNRLDQISNMHIQPLAGCRVC